MTPPRLSLQRGVFSLLPFLLFTSALAEEPNDWPPTLMGAQNGTVTIRSDEFLEIPETVREARQEKGYTPFDVAETPPTVDFAYHADLGPDAINRRLWSSWGDIGVASDGRVYAAIGDHDDDQGGDARCFVYVWHPERKTLEQIIDMNEVVPPRPGQPAWSKIHAKIDEGPDKKIYFSATLNSGQRANQPDYGWNNHLPGGQLYQYNPETGETTVFANLPPKRCTATSRLDHERNIWWCNLEAGDGDALWALDLSTGEPLYQSPDGLVSFNRAFALIRDGSVLFNGEDRLWKWDAETRSARPTSTSFGESPGMRSATRESSDGFVYGSTQRDSHLFRYDVAEDELTLLGPTWGEGQYTTVMVLSPDERFLYYVPGAHGRAREYGTPVIQYEIATGTRKVLAFLRPVLESKHGYVPGGTYGTKLSADGATLYINLNGHAVEEMRADHMRDNGFGLCGFAALHIPESER